MRKSVLIVEDEAGVRRALSRLLGEWGFRTIEASNGREAIQRLAEETPAAIVIDLLMPIMSGAELLKALRRNAFYRAIPTVVMTGMLDPSVKDVLGVPVLLKPNIERLPQLIQSLLGDAALEDSSARVAEAAVALGSGEIGAGPR
jgi:CheY-like chemotaxis protein